MHSNSFLRVGFGRVQTKTGSKGGLREGGWGKEEPWEGNWEKKRGEEGRGGVERGERENTDLSIAVKAKEGGKAGKGKNKIQGQRQERDQKDEKRQQEGRAEGT